MSLQFEPSLKNNETDSQSYQKLHEKKEIKCIWDADNNNTFSSDDVKSYIKKHYASLNNNQIKQVLDSLKGDFVKNIKYDDNKITIISLSMKVVKIINNVISSSTTQVQNIMTQATSIIGNRQQNSKRILSLAEKAGYNSNLSINNTRISNQYYNGNSYNIKYSGLNVTITNNATGKTHTMNLYCLLDNMNDDDAIEFLLYLQKQPAEVIEDLAIEMDDILSPTGRDMHTQDNQEFVAGGYYKPNNDSIVTSPVHLVHELGHAVDYSGKSNASSSHNNQKFMTTFRQELAKYKQSGKIQYDYNDKQTWKRGDEFNYCTANERELFAESYTLAMTGHCRSEKVINTYFPKSFKIVLEIIKETKNKSDLDRRYTPNRELLTNLQTAHITHKD